MGAVPTVAWVTVPPVALRSRPKKETMPLGVEVDGMVGAKALVDAPKVSQPFDEMTTWVCVVS